MLYAKFERLLHERGVKAAEVSRQTGVTTQALSAWKKGDYTPKADKIQKIADYFEVPISYFYEEPEQYYNNEETAKLAEEMAVRPGLRVLFDASRDLSDESLKMFAEMIETFKKTNG